MGGLLQRDWSYETPHPRVSHPCVNTLDIAARDRRARRLFGIRGFGRSEGNLGDFPAATSKKGKNVVAGYEGALDGEGWIKREKGGKRVEGTRVESGVWVSSKKPGSTTWWVGAMYQMFGLVRGAMDSGIDRIKTCKKLFSIYRPTSAPISSRRRCVPRGRVRESWNCDAQVIFPLSSIRIEFDIEIESSRGWKFPRFQRTARVGFFQKNWKAEKNSKVRKRKFYVIWKTFQPQLYNSVSRGPTVLIF